jgi:ATP-binding cassette, subfamily B, bacterial MsbA
MPTEPIEDGKPPLRLKRTRIEFADVRFAYSPDEPVMRGMSFVAGPGKITALVPGRRQVDGARAALALL